MKIICIEKEKNVKKTQKEIEQERKEGANITNWIDDYKTVPLKKPIYIVEMSMEELQLVSFYLELEKRKPIANVELEAKLKQEDKDV